MRSFEVLTFSLAALASLAHGQTSSSAAALPTIDLGYAVHKAKVNTTGDYYDFSNIRYAAPPVRFSAAVPPTAINRTVNDGSQAVICPQANPAWLLTAIKYLSGTPVANLTQGTGSANLSSIPAMDPTTSEDCLFLDVFTPTKVFEAAQNNATNSTGVPVLVWIYGGGYTGGNKAGNNPAGLLARAKDDGGEGLVYVAINYRLGAFGWMSGPTFQENGTANAGLHDQRLALEWIQKKIHLFGGDPKQVTVIGESAGAGSIMHQITAYGGNKGKVPFKRAITQSPGWAPLPSNNQNENIFQQTLLYASFVTGRSITTLNQLRNLTLAEMYLTNYAVVGTSPYGTFTYGPSVDGNFVPQLPGELLLHGQFDKSVEVMTGHNSNEGLLFASPFISNETTRLELFTQFFPAATDIVLTYMMNGLYPANFSGAYGYTGYSSMIPLIISEISFTCNTRYLATGFQNETYGYYFSVPPGLHGEDIAYTFFNGDTTTTDDGLPVNATVAHALQDYITSFALNGSPNEPGAPFFPLYGANITNQNIGLSMLGSQVNDTSANPRCAWLQKALYY